MCTHLNITQTLEKTRIRWRGATKTRQVKRPRNPKSRRRRRPRRGKLSWHKSVYCFIKLKVSNFYNVVPKSWRDIPKGPSQTNTIFVLVPSSSSPWEYHPIFFPFHPVVSLFYTRFQRFYYYSEHATFTQKSLNFLTYFYKVNQNSCIELYKNLICF